MTCQSELNMKTYSKHILTLILLSFLVLPYHSSAAENKEEAFTSVEERRIFALVQDERDKLEQAKKDVELREKELKTLEITVDKKIAEIDQKLAELKNLHDRIAALLAEKSAEEKERIKELGAIYDKMAPERAALALSGMDPALATDILSSMKPKAAAKVLNMLDKQKSSQLSTTFTTIQIE